MLKTFDIRVKSNHSTNWYDSFVVDTKHNRVTFNQCDSRRNGQVARYFAIMFDELDGTAEIYAESAEGHRQEIFSNTQCLKLALRLLQEVKAEVHQVSAVTSAHETANKGCKAFDSVATVTLIALAVFSALTGVMGIIEGADCVSVAPNFGVASLSAYLLGNSINH